MRSFILICLIWSPVMFVAATCVTSVRENAPGGPWVGEVVNTGESATFNNYVRVRLLDNNDQLITRNFGVCPSTLAPEQRAAWEAFLPAYGAPPARLLSAEPRSGAASPGVDSDGLDVRMIGTNARAKYALVEITNRSLAYYHWVTICGTLRTDDGILLEVAATGPFPFLSLAPGETRTKLIFFNSLPEGEFEFFAMGRRPSTSNDVRLSAKSLHLIRARTLIDSAGDPYLEVLAELTNPFDVPVDGLMASAFLKGAPGLRDEDIEIGCGGAVGARETVPITFDMPTAGALAWNSPIVESIGGVTGVIPSTRVPVSNVRVVDGELVGRFTNPTGTGLGIYGICVGVRQDGRLIDAFNAKFGPYLDANETVERPIVRDVIPEYDGKVSFDVIAFGAPVPRPR